MQVDLYNGHKTGVIGRVGNLVNFYVSVLLESVNMLVSSLDRAPSNGKRKGIQHVEGPTLLCQVLP